MDKAYWWARRAGFKSAGPSLAVFARESLYGEAVPDFWTLRQAFNVTRSLYSECFRGTGVDVFVFTFTSCQRAARLVAFKHTHHDDTVERLSYRRGECPWLSYQVYLGGFVKHVKGDYSYPEDYEDDDMP